MREKRGVEIDTHMSFFSKFNPLLEMLGFDFVSVDKFAFLENRIASVKI